MCFYGFIEVNHKIVRKFNIYFKKLYTSEVSYLPILFAYSQLHLYIDTDRSVNIFNIDIEV